jgi:pimeloyl-ACP methyl ester carboxylesterase
MPLEVLSHGPSTPDPSHPPLLFVHGSYCAAWVWAEHFLPYFARHGFAGHAVSLRGHGCSDGALTLASLDDYIEDVIAVAGELPAPPVVVGHSMGGLVVQHVLARHPVAAGILLASVPPSGLAASALHMAAFAPDVLFQLGLLQTMGPAAVSPEIVHHAFFSRLTPTEAVVHLMPRLQGESQRVSADLLCPPAPRLIDGQVPPVLVVGGDADLFLPVSALEETAALFKGELRILQGAPHGLMLDHAWWQPTADEMIAWLTAQGF